MNTNTSLKDSPSVVQGVAGVMYAIKAAFKIAYGHLIHSPMIASDGYHNLSDLAVTGVVGLVMYVSGKRPSKEYSYGLKEIETFAAFFIGLALLGTALGLVAQAIAAALEPFTAVNQFVRALIPTLPKHEQLVLSPGSVPVVVGVTSIFILLSLFVGKWQVRVGKLSGSSSQQADGTETMSDGWVEAITILGLFATLMHWQLVESLLGLAVAWVIGNTGWEFVTNAVRDFMKGSIGLEHEEQIEQICLATAGVTAVTVATFPVGIGHTAVCKINITTPASVGAKENITEQIRYAVTEYLREQGFQEADLQITCQRPNPNQHRAAYGVCTNGDGTTVVAPSLASATHLVVCDVVHGRLVRPKWVAIEDNQLAVLASKMVTKLYVTTPQDEEVESLAQCGITTNRAYSRFLPSKLQHRQ